MTLDIINFRVRFISGMYPSSTDTLVCIAQCDQRVICAQSVWLSSSRYRNNVWRRVQIIKLFIMQIYDMMLYSVVEIVLIWRRRLQVFWNTSPFMPEYTASMPGESNRHSYRRENFKRHLSWNFLHFPGTFCCCCCFYVLLLLMIKNAKENVTKGEVTSIWG
jgi:hypothetical protein